MGDVVQMFQPRAKPTAPAQARPAASGTGPRAVPEPEGKAIEANAGLMPAIGGVDGLKHLEEQGAAMQVLSALLFYAHQGHDDGRRARRAVVAMQEMLGGAPEAA